MALNPLTRKAGVLLMQPLPGVRVGFGEWGESLLGNGARVKEDITMANVDTVLSGLGYKAVAPAPSFLYLDKGAAITAAATQVYYYSTSRFSDMYPKTGFSLDGFIKFKNEVLAKAQVYWLQAV